MDPKTFGLLLFSVTLGSVGQYFFKAGVASGGPMELGLSTVMLFFRPKVMIGLCCYALATVSWLVILSKARLSLVYPFISISYIAVVLMGMFLFNEKVDVMQWLGLLLICGGVVLVGVGGQRSKDLKPPAAITAPAAEAVAKPPDRGVHPPD